MLVGSESWSDWLYHRCMIADWEVERVGDGVLKMGIENEVMMNLKLVNYRRL